MGSTPARPSRAADLRRQVRARHEPHGDVGLVPLEVGVEHLGDAVVVDASEDLGLPLEPSPAGLRDQAALEELEGDPAPEALVHGLENHALAALSERAHEAEASDPLPVEGRGGARRLLARGRPPPQELRGDLGLGLGVPLEVEAERSLHPLGHVVLEVLDEVQDRGVEVLFEVFQGRRVSGTRLSTASGSSRPAPGAAPSARAKGDPGGGYHPRSLSDSSANPPEGETQNWLRRAQEGGVTEFGVLYDHVAPSIYAWATLRLARDRRSEIDAQDVVQEVWLRAWDSIERIDAETTPFRKWIFRVAKLVLLKLLRDGRRRRQVNLGSETKRAVFEQVMDPATAISARIERDDTLARFLESVAGLPEIDRKLVSYCGLEGLGYEVAAQRLDSTAGAVARRWQRLRKRLAEGGIPRDLFDPSATA